MATTDNFAPMPARLVELQEPPDVVAAIDSGMSEPDVDDDEKPSVAERVSDAIAIGVSILDWWDRASC